MGWARKWREAAEASKVQMPKWSRELRSLTMSGRPRRAPPFSRWTMASPEKRFEDFAVFRISQSERFNRDSLNRELLLNARSECGRTLRVEAKS